MKKKQFDRNNPKHWWNCWFFSTYRNGGYITHMFFEGDYITACGLSVLERRNETGLMNADETRPGCVKCKKALKEFYD